MQFGVVPENHSVDKAIVSYHGRHGAQQFIKNKPIRYGYKLWTGTNRLGYVYWFEPYQGISTHISTAYITFVLKQELFWNTQMPCAKSSPTKNFICY